MYDTHHDISWQIKKEVFQERRHFLCKYVDPRNYFSYLRSANCLNEEDEERILAEITRKRQMETMLNILSDKGPQAYDNLCEAILDNGTQTFILKELNELYAKKYQSYFTNNSGEDPTVPDDGDLPLPHSEA